MIRVITASSDAQNLPRWSYLPPPPHVYNHGKNLLKIRLEAVFLKLTDNDQSSKNLICCLKLTPLNYLPLPIATYMHKVTKIVYVETDLSEAYQSYEVSCHDKNSVPCPLRFSCPAQRRYTENKYVRENRRVKMFAVGLGDIMQSFAMLLLIHPFFNI